MNKKRESGRIDEELVCFNSFVQRLREIDSGQEITFFKETNDPPDFWITVGGVEYAVEATSIVIDYGYDALCNYLLQSIRSESKANNAAEGKYAFTVVRRPEIPKRNTNQWTMLVSTAATKIQEMSNAPSGVESCLLKDRKGYLKIQKLSDQGSTIVLCRVPAAKWEGEVQEELSQLFKKAIEMKREKLKDVLHRCSNVILLFYDAYEYSDIEDAKQAFLKVEGYEWLHSIFMTISFSDIHNTLYPDTPGRRGVFLYSKNEQWHL